MGLNDLPPYTCGLEIAYHGNSMNGLAFMNIKNQSLAIQGYDEARGMDAARMYTGPGLCGLYTLHQFHKYNKPRKDYESLDPGRWHFAELQMGASNGGGLLTFCTAPREPTGGAGPAALPEP